MSFLKPVAIAGSALLIWCATTATAQPAGQPPEKFDPSKYVTREEHEKILKRLDQVASELDQVKAKQAAPAVSAKNTTADIDAALDEVDKTLRQVREQADSYRPGSHQFIVTGYGFAQFEDHRGSVSSFSAGVAPIILWRIGDRLLFETEFEVGLNSKADGGGTDFALEFADLSYVVTDWLTVGGGRFKTPLGIFNSRLESKWINKMPDRPLPYADETGIAQEATLGVFARGGFALGTHKFNYDIYVGNGPTLNTDSADTAGTLDFDNFVDENDNKAVGGRLGWQPMPELEIGYSFQWAKVDPRGFGQDVHAFTQAFDLSYTRQYQAIKGQIDMRVEWVCSNVSKATYGVPGPDGFGPIRFNNSRNSGYVQVAYRPTLVENSVLKNVEFVFRYDRMNISSNAPGGGWTQRFEFGIDYWLNASTVIKTAYECEDRQRDGSGDSFYIQAAMGF